ncbi:MAG: hypothetical protein GF401_12305 [Chitinivibrionales bacterium]|nr:hypothetical protein [Chitinivibrionales bacterium]
MKYHPGDCIVYRRHKVSIHPGPRAEDICPAPRGDSYSYKVPKYWRVCSIIDDNTIEAVTRQGKRHRLNIKDPNLKKPHPLFQLIHHQEFPDTLSTKKQAN